MAAMLRSLTYYQGIPVWRHVQVIQWATQIISGILVVALVVWFFANIGNEIRERDIPYGFDFLDISSPDCHRSALPSSRVVRHLPGRPNRRFYQHPGRLYCRCNTGDGAGDGDRRGSPVE